MAQPRLDKEIPPLLSAAGLAAAIGLDRTHTTLVYGLGLIPGRRVGPKLTVFRTETARQIKRGGIPAKPVIDTDIPVLLSSTAAAEHLGVKRQRVDYMFRHGQLRGRRVSSRLLVFTEDTIRAKHGPRGERPVEDPALTELLDLAGAAEILDRHPNRVASYYQAGRLPGREVAGTDGYSAVMFRRETVERVRDEWWENSPAVDENIPELVLVTEVAEVLNTTTAAVWRMFQRGELPGRQIEGDGQLRRIVYRKKLVYEMAESITKEPIHAREE